MFQISENLVQVEFYQNNSGHFFIKLNDGTMIDGVICFLLVSGTTSTKRHHHHHHHHQHQHQHQHSSKTNKTAAARAAAMVNHETGKL
ncbi:unnamed protein product [Rotaria sp. Silwood1]|nr:unnamed protein product [Rotaria sp. Silwood1]